MKNYYLTTPIYYVNDHPHIGHIYTTLVADTIARYRRLAGDRVYFLTGTDEHGQKIERAAAERGVEPITLADEVVARYHSLWRQLGVSHDDFIRTTEKRHGRGVAALVRRIAGADDFYVSRHEGLYCTACELYYTEKELLSGLRCPDHGTETERRAEENVFFRLSKYQDRLLEWYDTGAVEPASRANEVRQFVAQGLRDLSVSRTNVTWALPFPGYDGHTIYVWLDALANYITALGFGAGGAGETEDDLYQTFWQGDGVRLHLVGKDILRFHAVYWPAFLMSAGLPLPSKVWAHGWWLRDEQKISKSVGNIVRPDELIEAFGTDSLRYFLLREMAFGQDASFSDEAFIDRYNSDLANDLGNTASRLITLSRRAFDGCLPAAGGDALRGAAEQAVADYRRAMDGFAFHRALEALWKLLAETNHYLVANEPWKKLKDEGLRGEVGEVLWTAMEATRIVAAGLLPVLPEKAPEVLAALGAGVPQEGDQRDTAGDLGVLEWGGLPTGAELSAVTPIFPRIDKKAYLAGADAAPAKPKKPKKAEKPAKKKRAEAESPGLISIDDFFGTELKVAEIKAAEAVPKSKKLLKLLVDAGEGAERTLVAGIAGNYTPEELAGRQVVIVANLKPAKLMGIESNGMVLAASGDGGPVLLHPGESVANGTRVR